MICQNGKPPIKLGAMKKLLTLFAFLLLTPLAVPANAQNAGTAASAHPEATKAGFEMLQAGGSATDAAMAMMLALTVVEPQSSGIGGGGFLLHHDAKNGWMETIDGREMAPAAAASDHFLGADGKPLGWRDATPGGKSVGVPGNMRLMELAHKKWGKLPWEKLFEPAIKLAEQGYAVSPPQYDWMKRLEKLWVKFPNMQKLYWRNGAPTPRGTIIKTQNWGNCCAIYNRAEPMHFILARRWQQSLRPWPMLRKIHRHSPNRILPIIARYCAIRFVPLIANIEFAAWARLHRAQQLSFRYWAPSNALIWARYMKKNRRAHGMSLAKPCG